MTPPDSGEGSHAYHEESLRDLYDVLPENWEALHAQGYRFALNININGLNGAERSAILDFIHETLAGDGDPAQVLDGFPFDEGEKRPLEHNKSETGIYVKRPQGWSVFD